MTAGGLQGLCCWLQVHPRGHLRSNLRETRFGDTDVADPMDRLGVPWHPPRPRQVFVLVRPGSNSSSPLGWCTVRRPPPLPSSSSAGGNAQLQMACNGRDIVWAPRKVLASPSPSLPRPSFRFAFRPVFSRFPLAPSICCAEPEQKTKFLRHLRTTRHRPECWPAQKTVPRADDPGST